MRRMIISIYLIIFSLPFEKHILAQKTNSGLIDENMLHPLDSYTAYTFQKGEWAYNIPILGLSPGWMCWGITDKLTSELDMEAWLGGVPSLNFRLALGRRGKILPAIAYETMFQYLFKEINLLEGYNYLRVIRKGASWNNRINASWQFFQRLHLHFSIGCIYSEFILIENSNRSKYYGRHFHNLISPDLSFGIDLRMFKWLSFHSTASYGSTFIYLDNVPRKYQFTYGFRIKPFPNNKWGILRNLHIELASIFFYFSDAKETVSIPVPIHAFLYWQWGGR